MYQLPDGEDLGSLVEPGNGQVYCRFMPDGKSIIFVGQTGVHVCEFPSGKYLAYWMPPPIGISNVAASPDGKLLAVCLERRILVWRMSDGLMVAMLRGQGQAVGRCFLG